MLTKKQKRSLVGKSKAVQQRLRAAYGSQNSRSDQAVVKQKKGRQRVMAPVHHCYDPFSAHKVGFPALLGAPPTVKYKQSTRTTVTNASIQEGVFIVASRPAQYIDENFQREAWASATPNPSQNTALLQSFSYPRNPWSGPNDITGLQFRVVSKGLKIVYTGAPLTASGRFFVLNLRMPIRGTPTTAPLSLLSDISSAVQAHPETKVISAYEAIHGFELTHYVVDPSGVQNFYRLDPGDQQALSSPYAIWGSQRQVAVLDPDIRNVLRSWSTIYIVATGLPPDASFVVEVHEKVESIFDASNIFSQLADSPHTGIMPSIKGINDVQSTVVLRSRKDIKAYSTSDDQVVGASKRAIKDMPRSFTSGGGPLANHSMVF